MSKTPKIVIIGGVAGGASAAARARRLNEQAEIILLERGPYISFANCGMPYFMGGVITDRDRLLVQTPEAMQKRFRIDVRIETEALSINRADQTVRIRDLQSGKESVERYDILILSPGAEPIHPPLPGVDHENIYTLRSLLDMDNIMAAVKKRDMKRMMVVGGGFIGLEIAEAFRERGMGVTLVEMAPQVMNQIDPEMAAPVHQHLKLQGIDLKLGVSVNGFEKDNDTIHVKISSGETIAVDMVILAIGVKPEIKLAKEAGLTIGERGGIAVNETMQTSDPVIYAVGDAVETLDFVGKFQTLIPLAGPANRQGRMAADHALGHAQVAYRASQGTAICKVFDLTVGSTGLNEKTLKRINRPFEKLYIHPASHAGYYPGAFPLSVKLLYDPEKGTVLGSQIVGADGVDKRIDVFATAIRAGMTVSDLEHLELCYAPPYGSAKDPVNYAGFIATNAMQGLVKFCHAEDLLNAEEPLFILDVRTPEESAAGSIPGSMNIPVDDLRERLHELPKGKEILVYCAVGLRSYLAARILSQAGWKTRTLSGGYTTYKAVAGLLCEEDVVPQQEIQHDANEKSSPPPTHPTTVAAEIDARGLQCPGPIIQLGRAIEAIKPGEAVRIMVSDPGFATDAPAWCRSTGHHCAPVKTHNGYYEAVITKAAPIAASARPTASAKKKTLIVFSNDFDKTMATFIIANGAASMGSEVTLFFTFWGLNVLRKPMPVKTKKDFLSKMFTAMMPRGARKLKLSKLNMGGLGTRMMQYVMKKKQVTALETLIQQAQEAGVKFIACTMTMEIMGIKREELIEGVEEGGVANYLDQAENAGVNLFI